MPAIKTETIAIGATLGVVLVLLIIFLAAYAADGERPAITTAHVINLDRDVKKLDAFKRQAERQTMSFSAERWTATYGKDLDVKALPAQGIGNIIVQSGKGTYKEQWKDLRNLGAIGCFLSHRSLLQHCATLPLPDTAGHLILEDDAIFADDFQAKWDAVRYNIPKDWDIVYLGITTPKGHPAECGHKLYTVRDSTGNWGTHGYLVRHGALRTKVLPCLKWMFEAVDGQLNAYFDEWNVYATNPLLIRVDKTLASTIQRM